MPENLPEKPSIEHLKKQAKELLNSFRTGDYSTFQKFKLIKRYSSLSKEEYLKSPLRLHDAHYAIALFYGFQSWQQLSDYCTQFNKEDNMSDKIKQEFNRLKGLKNRAMQKLLRRVDYEILALALVDSEEGVKEKVFVNMSRRAGEILKSVIQTKMNAADSAVIRSRENILSIYKKMVKESKITEDSDSKEKVPVKSEPIDILKKKKASQFTINELKEFFYELCRKAYKVGLLQLDSDSELVDDDLIKKGLELIVDGTDPSIVETILKSKLEKALRDYKVKYESAINAIMDIQHGFHPEVVKEKLDASLP